MINVKLFTYWLYYKYYKLNENFNRILNGFCLKIFTIYLELPGTSGLAHAANVYKQILTKFNNYKHGFGPLNVIYYNQKLLNCSESSYKWLFAEFTNYIVFLKIDFVINNLKRPRAIEMLFWPKISKQ